MKLKKLLLIVTVLLVHFASGQPVSKNLETIFIKLSDGSLKTRKDTLASILSVKQHLTVAQEENDNRKIALAYKALIFLSEHREKLLYSDSMIAVAQSSKDDLLTGTAYMARATLYYGRKEHKKALDNFLKADYFISNTDDKYSIYKVKYGIAQAKYYLGFYDEAISLLRECISYFEHENERAYLNSLHCLGLCYNRTGQYDWCSLTNKLGIDDGKAFGSSEMEPYFIHSEGVNQCCKSDYAKAITTLKSVLPYFIQIGDFGNESVAYFYIGKAYWKLNQRSKAIPYFKKVDLLFKEKQYIRPDLREGYEHLIDYYKKRNDTKSQLFYINQLLAVDCVLAINYKYLLTRISKEYDTKELIKAKESITSSMNYRTLIGSGIIFVMAVLIVYLFYRHYRNKKLFEELMKRSKFIRVKNENNISSTDITPELEIALVKKLDKFEQNKKYLEKDMNLVRIANLLQSNTKYVTKIIAKHRNKGTIEYITDLKIDFIIELLKTESKYRNYTNKALAEEVGFGSTQNFTKAFKIKTGITPTYFIKQLKEVVNKTEV